MTTAVSDVPPVKRRHLAAAVVGNALEFYDFTVYSFFAAQIGHAFFPSKSSFVSLMASLVTFGVGFVSRPLGGIMLGAYGDRYGRKPAMLWSFALMGVGVILLAITPSFATIGFAAPIIVVTARIVQGFALGGEVGPTTAYLLEVATPQTRGFYTSLQLVSQGASTVLGALVGFSLTFLFNAQQLEDFGWRIAFMLGAVILPIGLIIRSSLPETHQAAPNAPLLPLAAWGRQIRTVVLGLMILGCATITTYILYFLSTYAAQYLGMSARVSFGVGIVFGVCSAVCAGISGVLSDRWGRKVVMFWPRVLFLLAALPCFLFLLAHRDPMVIFAIVALLATLHGLSAGASIVALTELLPKEIRSGGLATLYAVAIAVFGGSTQPVVAALLNNTGNLLSPAWYLVAASVVGVFGIVLMPETAPVKTGKTELP